MEDKQFSLPIKSSKKKEVVKSTDVSAPDPPEISGYLMKLKRKTSVLTSSWNKRWFLVDSKKKEFGYTYSKSSDVMASISQFDDLHFQVESKCRNFFLRGDSKASVERWVKSLEHYKSELIRYEKVKQLQASQSLDSQPKKHTSRILSPIARKENGFSETKEDNYAKKICQQEINFSSTEETKDEVEAKGKSDDDDREKVCADKKIRKEQREKEKHPREKVSESKSNALMTKSNSSGSISGREKTVYLEAASVNQSRTRCEEKIPVCFESLSEATRVAIENQNASESDISSEDDERNAIGRRYSDLIPLNKYRQMNAHDDEDKQAEWNAQFSDDSESETESGRISPISENIMMLNKNES